MGAVVPVGGVEADDSPRLTRVMSSRKLLARNFIQTYFLRWGYSPTLGEIAAHLDVSRKRAHDLVHQLAEEEMIQVTAGKTRGIHLPDRIDELSEVDILLRLAAIGWTVGHGDTILAPVEPETVEAAGVRIALVRAALTTKGLPEPLDLDFDPETGGEDEGTGGHQAESSAGERPARASTADRRSSGGKPDGLGPAPS